MSHLTPKTIRPKGGHFKFILRRAWFRHLGNLEPSSDILFIPRWSQVTVYVSRRLPFQLHRLRCTYGSFFFVEDFTSEPSEGDKMTAIFARVCSVRNAYMEQGILLPVEFCLLGRSTP